MLSNAKLEFMKTVENIKEVKNEEIISGNDTRPRTG